MDFTAKAPNPPSCTKPTAYLLSKNQQICIIAKIEVPQRLLGKSKKHYYHLRAWIIASHIKDSD